MSGWIQQNDDDYCNERSDLHIKCQHSFSNLIKSQFKGYLPYSWLRGVLFTQQWVTENCAVFFSKLLAFKYFEFLAWLLRTLKCPYRKVDEKIHGFHASIGGKVRRHLSPVHRVEICRAFFSISHSHHNKSPWQMIDITRHLRSFNKHIHEVKNTICIRNVFKKR